MQHIFGLPYFVFCFLLLIVVLYFTKDVRDEGFFGMSPGTLTQLQSTSTPSCMSTSMMNPMSTPLNDIIQGNLQKKGIMDMTESNNTLGFYALV